MRRVTDEQVALYLEEHEPSLDAAIISAVENGGPARASASSRRRLLRQLIENGDRQDAAPSTTGRRVERDADAPLLPARSAAWWWWRARRFCSGPPTCATRCRRCW